MSSESSKEYNKHVEFSFLARVGYVSNNLLRSTDFTDLVDVQETNTFCFISVGIVAANNQQSPSQKNADNEERQYHKQESPNGWNKGYEYKYNVETRTLTAIPELADQYSGIFTRAKLYIRPRNKQALVGRIAKPEYAQFHGELPGGYKAEVSDKSLKYQPMNLPSQPFEIFLKNGAIHHLAFDKNAVTNEQANQIKGIVSQLQFDSQAENKIKCRYNEYPKKGIYNAKYKVMEPTVTGNTETMYDVSPIPRYLLQSHPQWAPFPELDSENNFFEVVKTKNYSNAEQRMGYHYGITGTSNFKPGTNQMGDFLSVSYLLPLLILSPLYSPHLLLSAFLKRNTN